VDLDYVKRPSKEAYKQQDDKDKAGEAQHIQAS
jgi:hypothetical protein